MLLRIVISLITGAVCGALNEAVCFTFDPWGGHVDSTDLWSLMASRSLLATMGAIFGAIVGAVIGLIIGLSGVNKVWGIGLGFIIGVFVSLQFFDYYLTKAKPGDPLPIGLFFSLFGWTLTGFIVAAVTNKFSDKKLP